MQQRPRRAKRPLTPFERAVLRWIVWLCAIGGVVGFLGALDTGTVGDAVLGVALLAFGVAFPQIVLRVFQCY